MNSSVKESQPKNAVTVQSGFESDLEAMRTANFNFIYVLRKKNGNEFSPEDRKFAGQNIPTEMNRRTVSDSEKAIIVGSNFRMPSENMEILVERFTFDDLSKPENAIISNSSGK